VQFNANEIKGCKSFKARTHPKIFMGGMGNKESFSEGGCGF
jgi:hypothetical protein